MNSGSSSSALSQFSISQALSQVCDIAVYWAASATGWCLSMQAALKKLHNGKVTHLRVLIKSIVPSGGNATAVLKDPTGIIVVVLYSQVTLQTSVLVL